MTKRFAFKQSRDARNRRLGMLYTLPCALIILLMTIYPLIQMVIFSFSKVKLPFFTLQFAALDNFVEMVGAKTFGRIITNTLVWTFGALALRFILGFGSALLMDTGFKGKTSFRIITLMPWVVPSIVTANLWRWIYNTDNGILNEVLSSINPAMAMNWLGSKDTALIAVIIAYVWQGFPFIMLMIVSAMQGIPKSYSEAALVDGANKFQVFVYVTLPNLKNVLAILAVLEIINGFNAFDLLFTMTGGGPGVSSESALKYSVYTSIEQLSQTSTLAEHLLWA